jgi:hypothetical protein
MKSEALLTIITIHKGDLGNLELTAGSLTRLEPIFDKVVWIITTDEIIDKRLIEDINPNLKTSWLNLKDRGPFDAMNKSLIHVKSNYLNFLNSGDRICSELEPITFLQELHESNLHWGVANSHYPGKSRKQIWKRPFHDSQKFRWCLNSYCHQATFYKREFLLENQAFDTECGIADWKTSMKLSRLTPPLFLSAFYADYQGDGISSRPNLEKWILSVVKVRIEILNTNKYACAIGSAFIYIFLKLRRLGYGKPGRI